MNSANKTPKRKRWIVYVVVGLMLATMVMYLASQDEAEPEAVVDRLSETTEQGE